MKILLDNNNASIASIVNICCERINAEVLPYSNDIDEYDLIIKNCDENSDISEFDKTKTLFLVPKNLAGDFSSNLCLQKPFLPIDLINFLAKFGSNSQENQHEQSVSVAMKEKIAQDTKSITQIVKEIDDIAVINAEKNQIGGVSMPNSNIDNMIDEFYLSDDDRPLDELLRDINELRESGVIGKAENLTSAENSDNKIEIDENFDLDDDIPLDEFIKNMQNENTQNSDISENLSNDSEVKLDENFDLDDDIPLDEFIKNMQNESEKKEQINDEFNKILDSINEDDLADNAPISLVDTSVEDLDKKDDTAKVALASSDENIDDTTPIALADTTTIALADTTPIDENSSDEISQVASSSSDENVDDIIPIALATQDMASAEKDDIELANLDDEDLPIYDFAKDDLPPLELASDDDLLPIDTSSDDTEKETLELANSGDEFAKNDLKDVELVDENTKIATNNDKKELDFSDLKLVEVGKFADSDLEKKEPTRTNLDNLENKSDDLQKDIENLKIAENSENSQLAENLENPQVQKPQQVTPNSQDSENLETIDDEIDIAELREKLENTFKEAFERSIANDEKLAKALKNLKLDLNIAFKDK